MIAPKLPGRSHTAAGQNQPITRTLYSKLCGFSLKAELSIKKIELALKSPSHNSN